MGGETNLNNSSNIGFNYGGLLNANTVLKSSINKYKGLNVCHVNINSLYPKIDLLRSLLDGISIDVICITETWLQKHHPDDCISLSNFKLYRLDRPNNVGYGGVCIYVRDSIISRLITNSSSSTLEAILIELILPDQKILLGTVYKPPEVDGLPELEEMLANFSCMYTEIIFCGDFNYNLLKQQSSQTLKFSKLIESFSLHWVNPLVPTFFRRNSTPSLLDLAITNTNNIVFFNQIHIGTNHDLIYFSYALKEKPSISKTTYRDFNHLDLHAIEEYCKCLPWNLIFYTPDIDRQLDIFNKLTLDVYGKFVPEKVVTTKHITRPPWLNDDIICTIEIRDYAHALWKIGKSPKQHEDYIKYRNKVTNLVRKAKNNFLKSFLDINLPPKKFWRHIKDMGLGRKNSPTHSVDFTPDELNAHFCNSVSPSITEAVPADRISVEQEQSISNMSTSFSFKHIDIQGLSDAVNSIKSNATGLDGIPIRIIKILFPLIGVYILHIFNHSIMTSTIPKCWKTSKTIVIPKVSNAKLITDYRPISLLPAISKVFERILHTQIQKYLIEHKLLNIRQSAYRPGHSTETALLTIVDDIRRQLDSGKLAILVLLDFSQAFDNVNHKILLAKLRLNFGFDSTACNLICSYLSDRYQEVHSVSSKCPNFESPNTHSISSRLKKLSGVPQGSILGPLLFVMYINDCPDSIVHSSYHLYADDVQIYLSAPKDQIRHCISLVNEDISNIIDWSNKNSFKLNASKTQALLISNSYISTTDLPEISVKQEVVVFSEYVKNLGIYIDNRLNWEKHVATVRKRVTCILRSFWTIFNVCSRELRKKLVNTYIVPHFSYCSTVFFGMYEISHHKLNLAFNSCIRYVNKLRKFDHITPFRNTILGCSIADFYQFRVCLMIFNILNRNDPVYLRDKIIQLRSTRSLNLYIPRNTSHVLNSSFFVRGVVFFNSLPQDIKKLKSSVMFRRLYFEHLLYVSQE